MTDRYVVLVDAGYLLASAGALLHGVPVRGELKIDATALVDVVRDQAAERMQGELLRMYWYDAARDRVPTVEHRAIASLPGVKVRLGNLNRQGQQKGVDALLRSDLEALARNRAVARAVMVAGDEDMVPAVEAAQSYGVQVHAWSVEPPFGRNQAERLVWEADGVHEICRALLEPHVALLRRPAAPPVQVAAAAGPVPPVGELAPPTAAMPPSPALLAGLRRTAPVQVAGPDRASVMELGEHIAGKWLLARGRENLADLLPGPALPTVIDRELLVAAEEELGRSLRPWEDARRALRDGFWERLYREFGVRA